MARITIRLDDEVHDRLLVRAARSSTTLSELVRMSLAHIVDLRRSVDLSPQDAQVALMSFCVAMTLIELEGRSPGDLARGALKARSMLRKWGMPDEISALVVSEMEALNARQD